jgi:hypothetical protein
MSQMLSIEKRPFVRSVIVLNVIMLNVVAPIFTVIFPGGKQQLDSNPPSYHCSHWPTYHKTLKSIFLSPGAGGGVYSNPRP